MLAPSGDHVLIATKVGTREGAKPDLSAAYIREACDRSLSALNVPAVGL